MCFCGEISFGERKNLEMEKCCWPHAAQAAGFAEGMLPLCGAISICRVRFFVSAATEISPIGDKISPLLEIPDDENNGGYHHIRAHYLPEKLFHVPLSGACFSLFLLIYVYFVCIVACDPSYFLLLLKIGHLQFMSNKGKTNWLSCKIACLPKNSVELYVAGVRTCVALAPHVFVVCK